MKNQNEKSIAIIQSNYIPWKGYFDFIHSVDEFMIYDSVQYTKNDWRNRNKIKTPQGAVWLTIPVLQKSLNQSINETEIANGKWVKKHWSTIKQFYANAPYFNHYKAIFEELYLSHSDTKRLSEVNYSFIKTINELLGITTKITFCTDYSVSGERSERLVELCKQAGASEYISGPAAKSYLDVSLFEKENIAVKWFDYSGYPEYNQQFPPFDHAVTILDLLFNEGPNATTFMRSF